MTDALVGMAGGLPAAAAGAFAVVLLSGAAASVALGSKKLRGASLFQRLFVLVAIASGFFSAVSSAVGFALLTAQESDDLFRNALLPPAFGVFVFALALAIWVGGAELVRHRDWFRDLRRGLLADALGFIERAFKLFLVIPALATVLFFVSTWTTVVGIAGADAVRRTYAFEIDRLQAECAAISAWRQRDLLFREDLRLAVSTAARAAEAEAARGARTGSAGRGPVADYIAGVADWYRALGARVDALIDGDDPSGVSPYQPGLCAERADELRRLLAGDAFGGFDAWSRAFETAFNELAVAVDRWRRDRRVETLLDQQLAGFARANPRPGAGAGGRLSSAQEAAIDQYAADVEASLRTLLRKQRAAKPPPPLPSAAQLAPETGLALLLKLLPAEAADAPQDDAPRRRARSQAVVDAERVPPLSTIAPRDAVLKHAGEMTDVWALAIAWDYAAYLLMLAFLFFPSAERAPRFKDARDG